LRHHWVAGHRHLHGKVGILHQSVEVLLLLLLLEVLLLLLGSHLHSQGILGLSRLGASVRLCLRICLNLRGSLSLCSCNRLGLNSCLGLSCSLCLGLSLSLSLRRSMRSRRKSRRRS
jgi:hypothetical protein